MIVLKRLIASPFPIPEYYWNTNKEVEQATVIKEEIEIAEGITVSRYVKNRNGAITTNEQLNGLFTMVLASPDTQIITDRVIG